MAAPSAASPVGHAQQQPLQQQTALLQQHPCAGGPLPGDADCPSLSPLLQVQGSSARCRDLLVALQQEMGALRVHLDRFDASVTEREEDLQRKVARYEREKAAMERITSFQSNTVKLNVGGTHFDTSLQTLLSHPDSMLAAMFSGRYQLDTDDQGRYFIDRDGKYFDVILNYLRDGSVGQIQDDHMRDRVIREARFYMLEPLAQLLDGVAPRRDPTTSAPFCWDSFSPQVLTDPSFMTVSTQSTTWVHAWSSRAITDGVHYWEVKIDTYDTKNSLNVAIGVTREQLKVACIMGYSYNPDAWAYVCGTGRTSHNKSYSIDFAEPCGEGDVVGVKLDCGSRTLEFYKNGRSMGVAFTNVEPPVYPAVSLVHRQQATLQFPSELPAGVVTSGAARRLCACEGSFAVPAASLAPPPHDRVIAGPGMGVQGPGGGVPCGHDDGALASMADASAAGGSLAPLPATAGFSDFPPAGGGTPGAGGALVPPHQPPPPPFPDS